MAVFLSPVFGVAGQLFDDNGNPLAGGKIYTYAAGTTTNATTYTTSAGNIQHSNPILLDGAGRVPSGEIWLTDGISYKFVVEDANNALIGTYDNIIGINSSSVSYTTSQEIQTATAGQTVFTLTTMQYQPATNSLSVFVDGVNQYGPGAQYAYTETNSTTVTFNTGLQVGAKVKFTSAELNSSSGGDAFNVSYTAPYTGSVTSNVGDKLAEVISVLDFGADPTGVADSTAAFQTALGSYATQRSVFVPAGTYLITDTLYLGIYKQLIGESSSTTTLRFNSSASEFISGDSFSCIEGLSLENITSPLGTKTAISSYTPTVSNGWRNGVVRDIKITDFYYGIGSSAGLTRGLMFQNVYERVRIYNANRAVNMGSGSNANTWINCEWWNCVRGVQLNNVTTQNFISCGFEGCTQYDFVVEACNNIKFDTCYFEPAIGGTFDDSTGTFVNCHSTAFASLTTVFLIAQNNSTVYIHDFNDYNSGGGVVTGQRYYNTDGTSVVYGLNLTTRGGGLKITPKSTDGVIQSITQTGDWIITKYGNGLMTMVMNTDISTNTLIMVGATTSYSATLTLPDSFVNGNFVAQATIFFNSSAAFLLTDSPLITVRPKTANTLDIAALRPTSVGVDGYFYSISCTGFWK